MKSRRKGRRQGRGGKDADDKDAGDKEQATRTQATRSIRDEMNSILHRMKTGDKDAGDKDAGDKDAGGKATGDKDEATRMQATRDHKDQETAKDAMYNAAHGWRQRKEEDGTLEPLDKYGTQGKVCQTLAKYEAATFCAINAQDFGKDPGDKDAGGKATGSGDKDEGDKVATRMNRGGFAFPNGNGDTQLELDETQACAPFETLASLDAETQDLDPEDEAEYKSKSRYGV